uniref:Uncharacterized protein n=2 Tax=Cajanus cajan TaxID=3821 RepID=A0A151T417_CAJCA|nr:hypothetical protein KK1_016307 [Cajanus cajan]
MEESKSSHSSLNLYPVGPEVAGMGYPYAPEDWPEKGDVWGWRTGRRIVANRLHFQDRYLYLPERLNRQLKEKKKEIPESASKPVRMQHIFPSKLAVERYIKNNFPDADLDAFFASFSWKIPALRLYDNALPIAAVPLQQISFEESHPNVVTCQAKNSLCPSLLYEEVEKNIPLMFCEICCNKSGFCRHCCCILCNKTVSSAYGGYTYIKCEGKIGAGICGHVTHLGCALHGLLAGKVGENIGLDFRYQCRRCDRKTDMISQFDNLLQTCKAAKLDGKILKKIFSLRAYMLCGSEQIMTKKLLRGIELAFSKLQYGPDVEDTWKEDDSLVAHRADHDNGVTVNENFSNVKTGLKSYDFLDLDEVLQNLKKSQELEYKLAEETLQTQKTYLLNLYQQLESEKNQFACQNSSGSDAISLKMKQIEQETMKFEVMKKVANGFGRTPNDILREYFGLKVTD